MRARVISLVLLCGLAGLVCAQGISPERKYGYLVGQSDIIVLAAVTSAPIPALPSVSADATALPRGSQIAVSLKIQKVLRGELKEATLTVMVMLQPAVKVLPGGSLSMTGWTPEILTGKEYVLGLCEGADGLRLCGGAANSIVAGEEASAITAVIAAFPVSCTVTPPADPLVIDTVSTWGVTVKNVGKVPLELLGTSLQAYQPSQDFDDSVIFLLERTDTDLAVDDQPQTLKPGEEVKLTLTFLTNGPYNWRVFDAKVFPLPTMIQGVVSVRKQESATQFLTLTTRTAWEQVLVARPPVQ
jgi:hypothetical protein